MNIPLNCKQCNLFKTRDQVVIGRGDVPAKILIMGSAPGMSEDTIGAAFCGASGQLLDLMLNEAFVRSKVKNFPSIYFTNIVLCRPCDKRGGPNRDPNEIEILKCTENIIEIIKTVDPFCCIFAGDIPEKYYKKMFSLYFKIQHPSSLLRGGGVEHPNFNRNVRILIESIKAVQSEVI